MLQSQAGRWVEKRITGLAGGLLALAIASAPATSDAGTFTVTVTDDSGAGSLRQAILDANASADPSSTIDFNLPANGAISLASALPDITTTLDLDATSGAPNLAISGPGSSNTLLRVAAGTTTLLSVPIDTGQVEIGAGAELHVDVAGNASQSIDEVITDAGQLEKIGTGTLVLTGINDYSGSTTVTAGTLEGNTSSLPGNIINNAQLSFNQSTDASFTGVISGTGALEKKGSATLTLTGANSYIGGTTISEGRLAGSASTIPSSGGVSVATGATLEFSQTALGTFAGDISGDGALLKTGAARLTLTGANGYTGGTTVTGGVLAGDPGSIPGNVALQAFSQLLFDVPTDATFGGNISGDGEVRKEGGGTLTLTGTNSYSRGLVVAAGLLRGDTSTILGAVSVLGGASLEFDQASNQIFGGVIGSAGNVIKSGAGTLTLSADQTYTGTTALGAGRLNVNGALPSPTLTMAAGTTLGGTGTLGGAVTSNGGTIAPGTSIGTLAAGSVTFDAASIFEVEVDATGAGDLLHLSSSATLGGALLRIRPAPTTPTHNYDTPIPYTILIADSSVSGSFGGFETDLAFLDESFQQVGNTVVLTLVANGLSPAIFAQTPNQRAMANAIAFATPTAAGDFQTVVSALLALDTSSVPGALDAMAGELLTSFANVRIASSRLHRSAIAARLQGSPEPSEADDRWSTWLTGSFATGDTDGGSADARQVEYRSGGLIGGLDFALGSDLVAGVSLGTARVQTEISGLSGEIEGDSYQAALYGGWQGEWLRLASAAHYAYSDFESTRDIRFGTIDRSASASVQGHQVGIQVEAGLDLSLGRLQVRPLLAFDWEHLERDSFSETGASSLDLAVPGDTVDSLASRAGARLALPLILPRGLGDVLGDDTTTTFTPELRSAWRHEFGDDHRRTTLSLPGVPDAGSVTIVGATVPRDTWVAGIGWTVANSSGLALAAHYDIELAGHLLQHSAGATARLSW